MKHVIKRMIRNFCFIFVLAAANPAMAGEFFDIKNFSGNIAMVSDYVARGISQTNGDPALQGNIDYGYNGFGVGVWGSNVDFGSAADADVELDYYTYYTYELGNTS